MKLKYIYTTFTSLLLLASAILFTSYENGPGSRESAFIGAPGELGVTCGTCHNNPGAYGFVSIDIQMLRPNGTPVASYVPGSNYDIVITVIPEVGTPVGYGFQAVALDDIYNNAGTFSTQDARINITPLNGRLYAEHNTPSPSNTFSIPWQAPSTFIGNITFYASGNAVNGNGFSSGDSGMGTTPASLVILQNDALPSELISFDAVKSANNALLKWVTATEINSNYFAIEHAKNGIDFKEIGQVTAAGNTNELQTYNYRHIQPQEGSNYYRLREVAFDGTSTYSQVITLRMNPISGNTIDVFPNPVIDKTWIYLNNDRDNTYTAQLFLYDVLGQLVHRQESSIALGENKIEINMSGLESGYYFMSSTNEYGQTHQSIRLLKM